MVARNNGAYRMGSAKPDEGQRLIQINNAATAVPER